MNGVHRITWRHDCVNLELALSLMQVVTRVNSLAPAEKAEDQGLLYRARDWEVRADLPECCDGGRIDFPDSFPVTSAKPDILLVSEVEKMLIVIELTCPHERNMKARADFKSEKYSNLLGLDSRWTVHLYTVEFGAVLGTANNTVDQCWRKLGLLPAERKRATSQAMEVTAACSARIWFARFSQQFRTGRRMARGRDSTDVAEITRAALCSRVISTVGLTVAQVQKIERNRRRALALRGRKAAVEGLISAGAATQAAEVAAADIQTFELVPPRRTASTPSQQRQKECFADGWCLVCCVKVPLQRQGVLE